MDILEALAESATAVGASRKCLVQRWLDDIPADAPGKDQLVLTIEDTDRTAEHFRTVDQVDKLLYRLGLKTSIKTIGDHRGHRCRCFG